MDLYIREEWRTPAKVGVVAFAAGTGFGYFVCNRRWRQVSLDTIETMEEATDLIDKATDALDDDQEAIRLQRAADFARAIAKNHAHPADPGDHPISAEEKLANVVEFPDPEPEIQVDDNWDQEEEEANRSPDAPYVIHREEFYANPTGYSQDTLEYFTGDDILCDQERVPLYNAEATVGRLEFGRGSGDPDVVYIRNEALKAEYEVTRVHGSYLTEVHGIEAEEQAEEEDLKHSDTVRRFRRE